MNERQCILAANILNKHGGEAERRWREKVSGRNTEKCSKNLEMKNCHWWEEEKLTIVRHGKSSKKHSPCFCEHGAKRSPPYSSARVHAANVMAESVHKQRQAAPSYSSNHNHD